MAVSIKPKRASAADARRRAAKPVLGWVETVELPEWRVSGLGAKLDTGARSSALHVLRLRPDGPHHVRFEVAVGEGATHGREVRARVTRRARVRSSNGQYQMRVFVQTLMRIGPLERQIEVSLTERDQMLHRMLIGRTSLKGLLVDPARRHLLTPRHGA